MSRAGDKPKTLDNDPNLAAWWKFDETSGKTAADSSDGNNENPCWSPDGLQIVFASNRDLQWNLYVMNWDGSQLRQLTSNGGCTSPSWSKRLN